METLDSAAESFLNLEAQFEGGDEMRVRGRAVDVQRVPASEVPDDYPVAIESDDALALTVSIETDRERKETVYFAWGGSEVGGRLARLLALHDIEPDRFGDLHGERILLRTEAGHYVPVLPAERIRGSAQGVYGVAGGLAVNLLTLLLTIVGLGGALSSLGFVLMLLVVNFVVLPYATYVDGWYLRTQTDWGQWPAFWATLSAIPGVNLLSVPLYLRSRQRAQPLA